MPVPKVVCDVVLPVKLTTMSEFALNGNVRAVSRLAALGGVLHAERVLVRAFRIYLSVCNTDDTADAPGRLLSTEPTRIFWRHLWNVLHISFWCPVSLPPPMSPGAVGLPTRPGRTRRTEHHIFLYLVEGGEGPSAWEKVQDPGICHLLTYTVVLTAQIKETEGSFSSSRASSLLSSAGQVGIREAATTRCAKNFRCGRAERDGCRGTRSSFISVFFAGVPARWVRWRTRSSRIISSERRPGGPLESPTVSRGRWAIAASIAGDGHGRTS